MTQEELAESANIGVRTLQKVESGKSSFKMNTLIQISEALNVSVEILKISEEDQVRRKKEIVRMHSEDMLKFYIEKFQELIKDRTHEEIVFAHNMVLPILDKYDVRFKLEMDINKIDTYRKNNNCKSFKNKRHICKLYY